MQTMKCFWSLNQIEFDIGLGGNKKTGVEGGFHNHRPRRFKQ